MLLYQFHNWWQEGQGRLTPSRRSSHFFECESRFSNSQSGECRGSGQPDVARGERVGTEMVENRSKRLGEHSPGPHFHLDKSPLRQQHAIAQKRSHRILRCTNSAHNFLRVQMHAMACLCVPGGRPQRFRPSRKLINRSFQMSRLKIINKHIIHQSQYIYLIDLILNCH